MGRGAGLGWGAKGGLGLIEVLIANGRGKDFYNLKL